VAISTQRDEHVYGLLGVHFKQPRTFSVDEIAFMERVAAALAYAIARARSEEQFRTLVEHVPDVIGRFDANLRLVYANPALEALAEFPTDSLKGKTMRLVGHADPRGDEEYNMVLAGRRADNVKGAIAGAGLDSARMATTSRGEMDATGTDESGWEKDRRVDIMLGS